jgi:glutaryl-CoA dehydrogenase
MASSKAAFHWDDPLLLDQQLTGDERAVRDAAHAYCQERLAPRVLEAFRNGTTDVACSARRSPSSTAAAR